MGNVQSNSLKKNTSFMLAGQMGVVLFQGLQFFIVARALGPEEFGKVAAMLAITAILLPFSGVGAGNVMVMRLARQAGDVSVYLGNAVFVTLVSGFLLTLFALLVGETFLTNIATLETMLLFALSEIILTKLIDIAVHVFYGRDQHQFSGAFYALHSACRMLMAMCLFLFEEPTVVDWAYLHFTAGAVALLFVSIITLKQVGLPKLDVHLARKELKLGALFSIGLSSKSVYTNVDKAILPRYASPQINGEYTAAFRVIFMAYEPVRAFMLAAMARFFREGQTGLEGTTRFANQIIIYAVVYALGFGACVYFAAPLLIFLLGDEYAMSIEILQALALVPVLLVLQDVYASALTGADKQGVRSIIQVSVAVVCIAANLYLIPEHSWMGAVMATYLSQALLAVLTIGYIVILARKNKRLSIENDPVQKGISG